MNAEHWVEAVRQAVTLLGEIHAHHVQDITLRVVLHPMAADNGMPVAVNDGRPKVITLTVTTSG